MSRMLHVQNEGPFTMWNSTTSYKETGGKLSYNHTCEAGTLYRDGCFIIVCYHTDINASSLVSMSAEKLPSYVLDLHRDNGFNADEEYEVCDKTIPP